MMDFLKVESGQGARWGLNLAIARLLGGGQKSRETH